MDTKNIQEALVFRGTVQCVLSLVTTKHTTVLLLVWNMSGSTRVSRYQKGKTKKVKTNLDLLEQETVRKQQCNNKSDLQTQGHRYSCNSIGDTHTTVLLLFWNMSGTTRVSRYQKGKTRKVKTNLDLLQQEVVSGIMISY